MIARPLNYIEEMIKVSMLTYPTLCQTRWQVLEEMFLHGPSNYKWQKDGTIAPTYRNDCDPTVMDYSDLDERTDRLTTENYPDYMSDLRAATGLAIDQERINREFREANIDLFARQDIGYDSDRASDTAMESYNSYSNLWSSADMPHDAVTLKFLEEVIDTLKQSIRSRFGAYHHETGADEPERLSVAVRRVYDALIDIEACLDPQTNRRARNKASREFILKDIRKEEKEA